MSFEDEWAEMNSIYWNCRADVVTLTARVVELEQLLSEYRAFTAELAVHVPIGAKRITKFDELDDRARALLHEGQSDPAKEEQP